MSQASLLTLSLRIHLSHVWTSPANVQSPVSSLVITAEGQVGDDINLQDLIHYQLTAVQENYGFPHSEGRKVSKYQNVKEVIIFEGVLIHFCLIAPLENMWLMCKPYRILWYPNAIFTAKHWRGNCSFKSSLEVNWIKNIIPSIRG